MKLRKILMFATALLLVTAATSQAQDEALQKLVHGKKFFWEAKFDEALKSLKEVLAVPEAKTEYLFEAYLYSGFVLLRQNASSTEVRDAFSKAITLDPRRQLDRMVIPPDLTEPFDEVKNELVGCLYITSKPEEVDLVGVKGDSILFDETTPLLICDLVSRSYQLLLTEDGYEQQFIPLELTPGKTDTLHVSLNKTYASGGGKKGLKWIVRGGILAAAGAVLYKTVIDSGTRADNLPVPPSHPATR